MANAVTTPKVEFFKGTAREECETFVRSIRAAAWKEDKADDDRWIANYASLHFGGKALSWHSRLPPDVRRDWSKLELALLNQWPSPDDDGDDGDGGAQVSIVSTPAAAPNRANHNASQAPCRGVLKILSIESSTIFYLGRPDAEGKCGLTKNIGDALLVSVNVKANPHIIEELPIQRRPRHMYFWLGIHWPVIEPLNKPGSRVCARIALIDSITMKSSFHCKSPSFRITAWDVSAGGDIVPTWFQGTHKTPLDVFIDEDVLEIAIAADSNTYAETYVDESRGRICFQTLN